MLRLVCVEVQIVVDGKELPRTTELWYFAVNKPKGYLCASAPSKDGTSRLIFELFEVSCIMSTNRDLEMLQRIRILSLFLDCAVQEFDVQSAGFYQEWMETVWRRKFPDPRAVPPRLFTVGRLDVASTGLIFVTNDGMMTHPQTDTQ